MYMLRSILSLNANLTISIAIVAIVGDCLTFASDNPYIKALCDNTTHAVIGGLCWCICYLNRDKTGQDTRMGFLEILGCTALSSLIDLDHFIAAKSVLLKDATKLRHRPLLHCSTIPIVLFAILLLTSYILESSTIKRGALILLAAFMTHHIRDANRRGLWFYPYGSTQPIPYGLYIVLCCMVPYVVILLDRVCRVGGYKEPSDYTHVI